MSIGEFSAPCRPCSTLGARSRRLSLYLVMSGSVVCAGHRVAGLTKLTFLLDGFRAGSRVQDCEVPIEMHFWTFLQPFGLCAAASAGGGGGGLGEKIDFSKTSLFFRFTFVRAAARVESYRIRKLFYVYFLLHIALTLYVLYVAIVMSDV
jgi:hypothetical protein